MHRTTSLAIFLVLGCATGSTDGPPGGGAGSPGGGGGGTGMGGTGAGTGTGGSGGGTGGIGGSGGGTGMGGTGGGTGGSGGSGGGTGMGGTGGGTGTGGSGGGTGGTGGGGAGGVRDGGGPMGGTGGANPPPQEGKAFLYAASYEGGSQLTTFQLDLGSGALTRAGGGTAAGASPDYLAIHPGGRFLFVNNEVGAGRATAMAVGADGALTRLNDQPSGGAGPAHIWAHKSGKWVLTANYNDGKVAALPVGDDGRLGAPASVQTAGGNAHMVLDDGATGGFVFVPCASAGHVAMYRFDVATGRLSANSPATISAPQRPRHMAFNPNGKFAYVTHESRGALTSYAYDTGTGLLSAPRDTPSPNDGAHVLVHPTGNFVFHIARGGGTVTAFKVAADGALSSAGSVSFPSPYDATMTRDGRYLIVVGGTTVRVYAINPATGAITAAGNGQTVQRSQSVAVTVL